LDLKQLENSSSERWLTERMHWSLISDKPRDQIRTEGKNQNVSAEPWQPSGAAQRKGVTKGKGRCSEEKLTQKHIRTERQLVSELQSLLSLEKYSAFLTVIVWCCKEEVTPMLLLWETWSPYIFLFPGTHKYFQATLSQPESTLWLSVALEEYHWRKLTEKHSGIGVRDQTESW
jgi:hypothetical protein